MRKHIKAIAIGAALLAGYPASATDAAKETVYTPEQGDISFGVDLVPLFRTIGDAFDNHKYETVIGGTPFRPEGNDLVRPKVAISAKYMLTDRLAVSAILGLRVESASEREYTKDDLALALNPLSEARVVDTRKASRSGGSLMAGVEYRMGQRRVQGIFGGGLLFGFSSVTTSYTYGNKITDINQRPSTAYQGQTDGNGYRTLSYRPNGPAFALGVYGKIGVECFVAPKIALGATVDLYLYGTFGPKGYTKSEGFNAAYGKVEERTDLVTPGNRGVYFGTDNIGGSLYLAFYF